MKLDDLNNEQATVRKRLFDIFSTSKRSILCLSKEMDIPYSSLRSFMMGNKVGYKNFFKIKNWIK